ncbi:MAG TPA: transcriptional regulator [Nitrospiraceae bacterium]|nr:MAG: transcriptional regulator [Nitrospirae bacterium GWA2_46_11]OGW23647.1 MAG: transcriptional regulator [Nitrospirae bacterium GWB2_47_37]HAK89942.1 transcriptional regulator [Nitrospiraceae bacterium]HCL81250.1 transcriptional regulator [Nitrospiraceae bacterium]HCZ11782.1 transcriptional regulator [Nitrospiraceae bacterium]
MPDMDIILAKTGNIQRCLRRIREATDLNPDSLDEIDKQDIFVLNLQRAVEAAIDIAAHIVASEGLGLASTIKDNFKFLSEAGIIDENIFKKMQAMVGFRNIAVHDYQSIDVAILKSILTDNLKDIEEFYAVILKRFSA